MHIYNWFPVFQTFIELIANLYCSLDKNLAQTWECFISNPSQWSCYCLSFLDKATLSSCGDAATNWDSFENPSCSHKVPSGKSWQLAAWKVENQSKDWCYALNNTQQLHKIYVIWWSNTHKATKNCLTPYICLLYSPLGGSSAAAGTKCLAQGH